MIGRKALARGVRHVRAMLAKQDLIAIACKMIDTLGPRAGERMEAVVAAHVAEGDAEGAQFWGDVAETVRRLQAATVHASDAGDVRLG